MHADRVSRGEERPDRRPKLLLVLAGVHGRGLAQLALVGRLVYLFVHPRDPNERVDSRLFDTLSTAVLEQCRRMLMYAWQSLYHTMFCARAFLA